MPQWGSKISISGTIIHQKIQEKSTLFKGVAADDFFSSNLMDPTWNVKIDIFDGYLAKKKMILSKIYQKPCIFHDTGGAARCKYVKLVLLLKMTPQGNNFKL